MNRYPSLVRILRIDAKALLSVLIPFVVWLLDLASMAIVGAAPIEYTVHNLAILLIAVIALGLRIGKVYSIYNGGIQIEGRIRETSFEQIRGKIEYTYSYLSREYTGIVEVLKSGITQSLRPGDRVTAMIDLAHPMHSFLRDLYIKGEVKRYGQKSFYFQDHFD